jgi:hypothetical protein
MDRNDMSSEGVVLPEGRVAVVVAAALEFLAASVSFFMSFESGARRERLLTTFPCAFVVPDVRVSTFLVSLEVIAAGEVLVAIWRQALERTLVGVGANVFFEACLSIEDFVAAVVGTRDCFQIGWTNTARGLRRGDGGAVAVAELVLLFRLGHVKVRDGIIIVIRVRRHDGEK